MEEESKGKKPSKVNFDVDLKHVDQPNQISDGNSSDYKGRSTKSHESVSLTQSERGAISRLEFNNKELSRLADLPRLAGLAVI